MQFLDSRRRWLPFLIGPTFYPQSFIALQHWNLLTEEEIVLKREKENVPISVHNPTKATELDVNNSESLVVVVCCISDCHCCLPIQLFACLVYSPGSNRWLLWQKGGVKCWNTVWTNRLRCLRISSFLSSVPIACMRGLLPELLWLLYFLCFHTIF